MNEQLENEIETGFEFVKWNAAKSFLRELLKCPGCASAQIITWPMWTLENFPSSTFCKWPLARWDLTKEEDKAADEIVEKRISFPALLPSWQSCWPTTPQPAKSKTNVCTIWH